MTVETSTQTVSASRIALEGFRNFSSCEFVPTPGFNIICGQNAQGKTNLLESLMLVATGRMLRPGRDVQAIQHGREVARLKATMSGSGTTIGVELRRGIRKKAFLNEASLPRPSDLLGRLPVVSFTANDLDIVRGDPSHRRHFLDSELAQMYPAYLRALTVYKRSLEQRNALLKASQTTHVPDEVFDPWEEKLAIHGNEIRSYRRQWVEELAPKVAEAHRDLGSGEVLNLAYEQKETSDLLDGLASSRAIDSRRGTTSCGPHRDDLAILVASTDARHFGSQGQQRTAVIALKLAVFESVSQVLGVPPVLLLDDVFSDLDQSRRERLVHRAIELGGQVFLTCTEPEQAGVELVGRSKVVRVVSGEVSCE